MIRHVQDYGAIILMDERFSWTSNKNGISKWLRSNIQVFPSYDKFDLKMRAFFQQMKFKGFVPKVKQLEQVKVELDENGEQEIKLQSKKKFDIHFERSRKLQKTGAQASNDLGFLNLVNKNQEEEKKESEIKGTLMYMLKNPPKNQPKRKIVADKPEDDVDRPNKRRKLEAQETSTENVIKASSLSKYAFTK